MRVFSSTLNTIPPISVNKLDDLASSMGSEHEEGARARSELLRQAWQQAQDFREFLNAADDSNPKLKIVADSMVKALEERKLLPEHCTLYLPRNGGFIIIAHDNTYIMFDDHGTFVPHEDTYGPDGKMSGSATPGTIIQTKDDWSPS